MGLPDVPMVRSLSRAPRRSAIAMAALLGSLLASGLAQAQGMVPGCQLVDGSLQCVPGLTADPEQQIQILRKQISADQGLETVVNQQQALVQQALLARPALVGAVLSASLTGSGASPVDFHWYRIAPGQQSWQLIPEARGASYRLTMLDVGQQLMVVSVSGAGTTTVRQSSQPVGPVTQTPR
ncbi:hypothetical protein [Synechococcus sp. CS-1326]|uniref:hypothetical protein n=1 Tax=Synechococcus sp. CS-1326 TaxID=2847978 RepID=UPI00223A9325|nr:hypothetical protein [Synechococcus sp. CS-1326]